MNNTEKTLQLVNDWNAFFAGFKFKPHPRFLNTVANKADADSVAEYVKGYFMITGNPEADAIAKKCEDDDAKDLFARTSSMRPSVQMNARLDIFYSRLSNGCDDLLMKAAGVLPDVETVWCDYETGTDESFAKYFFESFHRTMETHGALFRKFGRGKDGTPTFIETPLTSAMKNGVAVILQHINLLPIACQHQVYGITDQKESVTIGGIPDALSIKPGFRIVATMNLLANGRTLPLSTRLADRASSIREFTVDAEKISKAPSGLS